MKIREIVKVDSKGRITIPLTIREALDIREGMTVLLIADKEKKEIIVSPIPERAKLVELSIRVEDRPGVLAELTRELADRGIDIIATKCIVLKRGEIGECYMVVDLSRSLITNLKELEDSLKKLEPVREVRAQEIHS
ncbi:transcriptional regulator, AbrB family [Staphylothermus marinus F1]|uniref:Transcriptional regulator, AbrB family n=1 Tax=Staphylothermus marinus (strain ATCC 43588 / DSM 3639 / JCM 9404 / F1) TaxID=399550 RepID=A3DN48_STAMF|nr:AbrB/MazE/SpoVT family DNA-binding domain-containing protein [Staphylothermus marinus]ABN70058.1 transcriptional regulator, AbrB family [Staphylothermus marinus F1]